MVIFPFLFNTDIIMYNHNGKHVKQSKLKCKCEEQSRWGMGGSTRMMQSRRNTNVKKVN